MMCGLRITEYTVVKHEVSDGLYTKYWGSSQNGKDYLGAPSMDGF